MWVEHRQVTDPLAVTVVCVVGSVTCGVLRVLYFPDVLTGIFFASLRAFSVFGIVMERTPFL